MSKSTRREFIKRDVLRGLLLTSGISLLSPREILALGSRKSNSNNSNFDVSWEEIRTEFILKSDRKYFNAAGLGPSPKIVVNRIVDLMRRYEENGAQGKHYDLTTHANLSEFLNTDYNEVAITRNCTESMNIVAHSLPLKKGDEIVLTTDEHIGGAAPWLAMQKTKGITIKLVELDYSGKDNLKRIKKAITRRTCVVVISHITCTTGLKLPVKEVVDYCRKKEIYSCIDGAQAVGMIPVNLKELNPDFYVASGHKWLCGPKGTGILYINKNTIEDCVPPFVGAYSDSEFDLNNKVFVYHKDKTQREEYGTRNVPIRMAFGTAIRFVQNIGIDRIAERSRALVSYFYEGIKDSGIETLTPIDEAFSASIVTIRIPSIDTAKEVRNLWVDHQIRVRYIYENGINGIRISFAFYNSEIEVDQLVYQLKTYL